MRKTEKKLRHKKIKYCVVNYHDRYDRNFVRKVWGDAQFVPNGKTMRTEPFDDMDYEWLSQKKVTRYLERWLLKRVGQNKDDVFTEFTKLGWRNTYEMNLIWNNLIKRPYNIRCSSWRVYWGLYLADDDTIQYKERD